MEKMRGIFPVLFALVLALGIVLVPVQEARAEFPKPTDGICPCCGHVGLKTSELSSPYGFPMDKYVCPCGYEYDPAVGDPDGGIAPGTAFEDIPDDWVCPVCGIGKDAFDKE